MLRQVTPIAIVEYGVTPHHMAQQIRHLLQDLLIVTRFCAQRLTLYPYMSPACILSLTGHLIACPVSIVCETQLKGVILERPENDVVF